MKKKFICFILLFFSINTIFAQSYLELLWEQAENNSIELNINRLEFENKVLDYDSRYYSFIPSFYTSTNYDFKTSQTPENLYKYPMNYYTTFGFEWLIPGGTTFSSYIKYDMNRYVLNSLEEISVDNTGYNQNPVISFTLSQSLLPYYFQGKSKNPIILSYENNFKTAQINFFSSIADTKKSVADYFIQLRKLIRNKTILENQIKLQSILCETAAYKFAQGVISQIDYWEYENKLYEYQNNLNEIQLQLENLRNAFELLTGNIDISLIDSQLPDYKIKLLQEDNYLISFEIQEKELENNLILLRQNYSPTIQLSGSYSYNLDATKTNELKQAWSTEGEKKWTVTLGLSLSPENINQINKASLTYKNNLKTLEEQKRIYLKNKKETINYYKKNILFYEEMKNQKTENIKKQESYLNAIKDRHKRGLCSDLDLLQAGLIFQNAKFDLENIEDVLWYFNFLLFQLTELE